ncbi:MAG TPA: cell division FtsA domain-containing protein [Clostridia bacterium]|nr:cell division FtsA domain-containing protein [Clostridia bacterium]
MNNKKGTFDNYIYSLDIGTRNVVGMIGKMTDEAFTIIDYELQSHPERAMFDGQIHDINRVAKVVRSVTSILESRNEIELKEVAIAAAGRALKTKDVTVEREIDYGKVITQDLIDNIEMEGIQKAQDILDEESNIRTRYYCVGYTSKVYYLDGALIKSPLDHRGTELKVDIIATFLPHVVVDSLYTVIDKSNLEVINLTLEPIAAINVAIPDKLRMLNLALVDIGAGTSDIALTKAGSIISYGMVASAGDTITDQLVQEYLLDFDVAEQLKIDLLNKDQLTFEDIVGISHEKTKVEILELLDETLDELSKRIAGEIIEKNGKKPSAVFCIGGGCQVPGFTEKLALALDLKNDRITIKGVENIPKIDFLKEALIGPEYITPVGIGFNGVLEKEKDFLQVSVNGKKIRLFNSKKLSVSHALILVGFHAKKLLAQRGKSITFTMDGKKEMILGDYGESANIYINGVLSSLDTKIKNRDSIYVEEAVQGKVKNVKISDYISIDGKIYLNNKIIDKVTQIKVNNETVPLDYTIKDGDLVDTDEIRTLDDLCTRENIDFDNYDFFINGEPLNKASIINVDDQIKMEKVNQNTKYSNEYKIKEKVSGNLQTSAEGIKTNSKKDSKTKQYFFSVNEETVEVKSDHPLIFVDIFEYIDFDLKTPKGILDLRLNGNRAKYTDELEDGDIIEIKWR